MSSLPSVTVIVPVLNGERTLAACLDALVAQTYGGTVEIIVVNDGSTDRTSEIARGFAEVRLLEQENQGRAKARNNAVALATGEIMAFTDSDCIPHLDWLECLVKRLLDLDAEADRHAGIVGGAITLPAGRPNLWRRLDHQAWAHSTGPDSPGGPTLFGSTANMCVRRCVYDEVGGFDGLLWGSEDSDLAFRIHKAGYVNYFEPTAVVVHDHGRSCFHSFLRQRFNYGKWTIQTVLKHKPLSPYSWMFPNNCLLLFLFWPAYAALATAFTVLRAWKSDASVFLLSPLHFLGRLMEYLGTVFGCREYQKKYGASPYVEKQGEKA